MHVAALVGDPRQQPYFDIIITEKLFLSFLHFVGEIHVGEDANIGKSDPFRTLPYQSISKLNSL